MTDRQDTYKYMDGSTLTIFVCVLRGVCVGGQEHQQKGLK